MKSGASQTFHFNQRLAEKQENKYKKKGFHFFGHPQLQGRVTKRAAGAATACLSDYVTKRLQSNDIQQIAQELSLNHFKCPCMDLKSRVSFSRIAIRSDNV